MKTRKIETRFMNGNLDVEGVIVDILVDKYGCNEAYSSVFSDDTIYSDGFVNAIEAGKTPILGTEQEAFKRTNDNEYHHFSQDDVCYTIYFE